MLSSRRSFAASKQKQYMLVKKALKRITSYEIAKHRNDTDIMIALLQDGLIGNMSGWSVIRRESEVDKFVIAFDLLEEGLIRGDKDNREGILPEYVTLHGITLKGREYLEKLLREKRERGWLAKAKRFGLLGLGSIGTILFNFVKKHYNLE